MIMTATVPAGASPEFRDRAHDLRNLFGAIASARHLLDDHPDEERRILLLDAIEEGALRGGALTTRMLAASPDDMQARFDPGERLRQLEPLLSSIAGAHRLAVDAPSVPVLVRGAPDRFDLVALELVANACKALADAGTIRVRLRVRPGTLALLVADSGHGMSAARCRALLTAAPAEGANGTGLQQVQRFARDFRGRLRIRSIPGRGTVVALDLPLLLGLHPG